jgi:hypothetical protein
VSRTTIFELTGINSKQVDCRSTFSTSACACRCRSVSTLCCEVAFPHCILPCCRSPKEGEEAKTEAEEEAEEEADMEENEEEEGDTEEVEETSAADGILGEEDEEMVTKEEKEARCTGEAAGTVLLLEEDEGEEVVVWQLAATRVGDAGTT